MGIIMVLLWYGTILPGEGGGRGWNLQPKFQKGGLDRISAFRGGCWKRRGNFSQKGGGGGGMQFSHKK